MAITQKRSISAETEFQKIKGLTKIYDATTQLEKPVSSSGVRVSDHNGGLMVSYLGNYLPIES